MRKKIFPAILILGFFMFLSCTQEQHKTVYLALIWHQHQPSYENAATRSLIGPWVRTHATKDYFDMAYRIQKYPDLHMTINLSSVLLNQLDKYYIQRLKPFIHLANEEFRVDEFKARFGGKTDPWLDLLITPSASMTAKQRDYLYNWSGKQAWNCFSISDKTIKWFPEYIELIPEGVTIGPYKGSKKRKEYTIQDRTNLKFLFAIANFDPMFLRGAVKLPIRNERGEYVYTRVHRWIRYEPGDSLDPSDDRYYLKEKITEKDCQQLVVEIYKILLSVVKIHRNLQYDQFTHRGQIEVITTPYYHPILPLIYDSDVMKINQPDDPQPTTFSYPEDAKWQVRKGINLYKSHFRNVPTGMWPGEGSVSKDVIHVFANEGIQWIATGPQVLARSLKKDNFQQLTKNELSTFYNVKGFNNSNIAMFFRDLEISDDIAFNYPGMKPREAVQDFVSKILAYEKSEHPDPLVVVLLDGENCWENFVYSHDGHEFLNLFYHTLDSLQKAGRIKTVTPIEYINGNPARNVKSHPLASVPAIDDLWPGCWFAPDFSVWIGEEEENTAWEYLAMTRKVFDELNLIYNPQHPNKYIKRAWEEMFAAEGSDWFWWYGDDQTAPGGADVLFDFNFRLHLKNVFYFLSRAGFDVKAPDFPPIISKSQQMLATSEFEKEPRVNGYIEKLWKTGAYIVDDEGGAQFSRGDLIKAIYSGYKGNDLYVALDAGSYNLENEILSDSSQIVIYLLQGDKNYISVSNRTNILNKKKLPSLIKRIRIRKDAENEISAGDTTYTIAVKRNRLELKIPEIIVAYPTLQVFVQYRRGNLVDFAPNAALLTIRKE